MDSKVTKKEVEASGNIDLGLDRINPKISNEIADMITISKPNYRFYGEFYTHVAFKEQEGMGTAGVTAKNLKMWLYYDPKFLNALSPKQTRYLLYHEIAHLLYDHINRTQMGGYDQKKANIAQDCIINSVIEKDFDHKTFDQIEGELKNSDGEVIGKYPNLKIPPEYTGDWMFEPFYRWMEEQEDEMRKNGELDQNGSQEEGDDEGQGGGGQGESNQDGNQDGEGQGSGGNSSKNKNGGSESSNQNGNGDGDSKELKTLKDALKNSETGETMDVHMEGLSDTEREYIEGIINGIKARGTDTGHFEKLLEKLTVTRKDNLRWIKQKISQMVGTKPYATYKRPNRHGIEGKKGRAFASTEINAILDTSGSMGGGLIEKVLSNLYQNDITINVIMADTEIKDIVKTQSKTDLQRLTVKGFGGTELQPAINYVSKHKQYSKLNTVVLTDGWCDSLDFSGLSGRNLIITCDADVDFCGGNTKQIKMDKGDHT